MLKSVCVKGILLGIVFSTLVVSGYAQANPNGTERGRGQTPPYLPNSIPNTPDSERGSTRPGDNATRSADPVIHAVQLNVAEIEAGKMAAKKAENPRVKEFANMMVR